VKKTRLTDYDSNRSGGVIAINLLDGDELISARLATDTDDLILVSKHAQSARFTADDATLRPMGRATSGVTGMRFRAGDELLAMDVVREGADLLTVTDGGFAKRTPLTEWAAKGRGILGMRAMRLVDERGGLVGALVVDDTDEVFAITSGGGVIRTPTEQVRQSGRDTMGVRLINLKDGDALVAVARNAESDVDTDVEPVAGGADGSEE
jgi:DNA gyrase subunit A